jgi:hypothetical protein
MPLKRDVLEMTDLWHAFSREPRERAARDVAQSALAGLAAKSVRKK